MLQAETAPFGVKVIVVEPSGGFKTDRAGSSMIIRDTPEAYAETVSAINTRLRQNPDGPAGDPVRAAEILAQVAKRRDIPCHLPLGVTAAEWSIWLDEQLLAEDRKRRRQPLRRLRRALPGRVPARHQRLNQRRGCRAAPRDITLLNPSPASVSQ